MDFLNNKWLKRGISFISGIYACFILWLAYMSAFFKPEYKNIAAFSIVYVLINIIFLSFMIYTRKQPFTALVSMLMMVILLPVVYLNLDNFLFFIPPAVVILTMFFACKTNETLKTVLGTVFLLMYILGGLGFFIVTNLFIPKTTDTILQQGVSNTGVYRYYVLDVQDNSTGRTEVYVEPNDKDKDFGFMVFKATGYEQRKYNARNHEMPTVEWREGDKLYINNERYEIKEWNWKFNFD